MKQKSEKGGSAVIIPFPRYRIKRVPERTVVLVPYLNLTQQKDPSGGSSDAMTLGIALPNVMDRFPKLAGRSTASAASLTQRRGCLNFSYMFQNKPQH